METLRLKDLLIQALKLPPFLAPSPSLTTLFFSSGLLHRVKFLAPSVPIPFHALKAITTTKPKTGLVKTNSIKKKKNSINKKKTIRVGKKTNWFTYLQVQPWDNRE